MIHASNFCSGHSFVHGFAGVEAREGCGEVEEGGEFWFTLLVHEEGNR